MLMKIYTPINKENMRWIDRKNKILTRKNSSNKKKDGNNIIEIKN
jgi:hypothetical protein